MKRNKLLEYDVVIVLHDEQTQKWEDMGITPPEDYRDERMVKYAFDASKVSELRQTYVKYKGSWMDAVVCVFGENNYETPPLVGNYSDIKRDIDEYDKEGS